MTKKDNVDVNFKVQGSDWKAHGHLRGSKKTLEVLEKVFEEIEEKHAKKLEENKQEDTNAKK